LINLAQVRKTQPTKSRPNNYTTIRLAFRSINGAIDLASIMVGIIVMGIIGGVVGAVIFAVIPWSQDNAAKQAVTSVHTAESVIFAREGAYVDMAGLKREKLVSASDNITVDKNASGSCYAVASHSSTGKVFYATSKDPKITEDRSSVTWCAGLPARGNILEEIASTSIVAAASGEAVERGHVTTALVTVRANHADETTSWSEVSGTTKPSNQNQFSISFDHGQNDDWGVPEIFGTRVGVVTLADTGQNYIGIVFTHDGQKVVCELTNSPIVNGAELLAAVGADMTCPTTSAPVDGSAIRSIWAWGNSVDPAVDARGLGQDTMTPEAIVAFATAHELETVYLNVPWAADNEGPIKVWLKDTVDGLHGAGIKVGALGGDHGWVDNPALGAQWVTSALNAAPFDSVQADVETWTSAEWESNKTVLTTKYITLLDQMNDATGDAEFGVDAPYWLATSNYNSGTILSAVLPHADTIAIVAFSDHADGADGIIALATPAVTMVTATGKPFTIGVETDTPQIAGGAQYTFYDEGSAVLETETKKVETAFSSRVGYSGVTVEHLRSWLALG